MALFNFTSNFTSGNEEGSIENINVALGDHYDDLQSEEISREIYIQENEDNKENIFEIENKVKVDNVNKVEDKVEEIEEVKKDTYIISGRIIAKQINPYRNMINIVGVNEINIAIFDLEGNVIAESITNTIDGVDGIFKFLNVEANEYKMFLNLEDRCYISRVNGKKVNYNIIDSFNIKIRNQNLNDIEILIAPY